MPLLHPKRRYDALVRVVYPVKHYKDAGFVERKVEITNEDLPAIIEEYLLSHGD